VDPYAAPSDSRGARSPVEESADESERRDRSRARAEWRGQVRPLDRDAAWERCWMWDLSRSGTALEVFTHAVPHVGARVLVRFDGDPQLHQEGLQLRGIVQNRREGTRVPTIGVEFVGLTRSQSELLAQIVATVEGNRDPNTL